MLKEFVEKFPRDLLTMRLMILAVTVWIDIMMSPSRDREMCVDPIKKFPFFSFFIYL
jgi:hypothetical protein